MLVLIKKHRMYIVAFVVDISVLGGQWVATDWRVCTQLLYIVVSGSAKLKKK